MGSAEPVAARLRPIAADPARGPELQGVLTDAVSALTSPKL